MKLLVLSDTHGKGGPVLDLAGRLPDIGACIFLGDGGRDADLLADAAPNLPMYRVKGNCDFSGFDPEEGLAAFGGVLFYYTHGHTLGVKRGLDGLWQRAKAAGANAALFGHTHAPYYEFRNGIHLFNPGSLTQPRGGTGPTFGLVTAQKGKATFDVYSYGRDDFQLVPHERISSLACARRV